MRRNREYETFESRSRRPWIVILVLAFFGVVFFARRGGPPEPAVAPSSDTGTMTAAEEAPSTQPGPVEAEAAPAASLEQAFAHARRIEEQGSLLDARMQYLAVLERVRSRELRNKVEQRLGEVNLALVTTPRMMPEKEEYVVNPGDSLDRIARRFGTTVDLVQHSNQINNPNLIKAGDLLRVFTGTFEIEVSKSRRDVVLRMNGQFFKRYIVGTGRYGKTPVGTFRVTEKQKEPVWWPKGREIPFGDPENILGTRWLAIEATGDTPPVSGYGIHGTWDNSSLGTESSAGCVRMRNEEVEELYMLVPVGTRVIIVD